VVGVRCTHGGPPQLGGVGPDVGPVKPNVVTTSPFWPSLAYGYRQKEATLSGYVPWDPVQFRKFRIPGPVLSQSRQKSLIFDAFSVLLVMF